MAATTTDLQRAYGISEQLAGKVVSVSDRLGLPDPAMLANAIEFETGGTWNPKIKNPASGATGLIQFVGSTARELGTSTYALGNMSAVSQMEYVYRYFKLPRIAQYGPLRTQADVFMAIFQPSAIGKGLDHKFNFDAATQAMNPGVYRVRDYYDAAMKWAKIAPAEGALALVTGMRTGTKIGLVVLGVGVIGGAIWWRMGKPRFWERVTG